MTNARQSAVADFILARLAEILERQARIEDRIDAVAQDLDALDRALRPWGDGTRDWRRLRSSNRGR